MRFPTVFWPGLALVLLSGPLLAQTPAPEAPPPAPAVKLVSVMPEKILYDEGTPVAGTVTVKNLTKTPQTVTVRAWLEWELNRTGKPLERTLTLAPEKDAVATFAFPKTTARYGHALEAEVLLDGKVVDKGESYFNACNQYWNVALIWAIGYMWDAYDEKAEPKTDPSWVDRYTDTMRSEYSNGFEHFFWAKDDFLGLTGNPGEVWWSGQARYRESTTAIKTLIDASHRHGIKATTYAKLTGGGSYGAEMARRHPEWMWNDSGVLSLDRQTEKIAKWDVTTAQDKQMFGWVPVNWNMNDPKVVEIGIKALADSTAQFGWDGARWDGTFEVRAETFDLAGQPVDKLTSDQVDARNAANMRRTKDYLSKLYPRFIYGYNWTQGNWAQSLANNPRESAELCRDNGLIMNEYINAAEGVQHPLHRWDVYAPSVVDDVERIKALGGYYGPILGSPNTADGCYTNVFAYAAGAHPYYHHLWGEFVTRYSAFIWDTALTRRHNPDDLLQGPSSVWWRHWVFERPLDATHKQFIVHLINPPAKSTVGEGKTLADLPPPVKGVTVTIYPQLLDGWKPVSATRLSPAPMLKEAVPVQQVEGLYRLTVPEVALWNILVVDLQKGGR